MSQKKFSKKKSEEIARKLEQIWLAVSALEDEDMERLEEVGKGIREETSKLNAVAGILVDFDKAEAKQQMGQASTNRLKGIKLIRDALTDYWKINAEYANKRHQKEAIDQMFGL